MAQPVQNACAPSSIYGGFDHTLFMGCSVQSFSCTVGWNEQVSEVTVQIVEDPCTAPVASPKHYWDEDLNAQTTTAADPGFIGTKEMIGAPMFFRIGNFEFCGLLQDYEQHNSFGGRPTYTVKLVSPQLILEGVQLIVGEYSGATDAVVNLYNPFGYLESFGTSCNPTTYNGCTFGTLAGGWGGSGRNENGMAWNNIIRGFNILCNIRTGVEGGSWGGGRVTYRGYSLLATQGVGGHGLMPGTKYYVDVSELPAPPSYYRLEGPAIGLLESISQVCEESGYDYYLELVPVQDAVLDATGIAKFIKFRTVSRTAAPNIGAISSFISARATDLQSSSTDGLMDSSEGYELRNEVTSTFYFGGNEETVYQTTQGDLDCDQEDIILPYWGLDSDKNLILSCKDDDGWWEFSVETDKINASLQVLSLPDDVTISEKELLFAAAGFDEWESYEMLATAVGMGHDIGAFLAAAIPGFNGGKNNFAACIACIAGIPNGITPRELQNTALEGGKIDAAIEGLFAKQLTDIDKIFEWLSIYATDFYGKKYAVRVPYTCAVQDEESALVFTTEVPQNDGWTEETDILGLPTSGLPIQLFRGDDGKYQSFCSIAIGDKILGWSNLDETSYGIYNGSLYMKSSVEGVDWVYGDFANRLYPRAVLSLSQAIKYPSWEDIANPEDNPENIRGLRWLLEKLADIAPAQVGAFAGRPGAILMNTVLPYKVHDIEGASFGVKSNIHVYGPWGYAGPAGKVRVNHDTNLTPWSFNGSSAMNTAGAALAMEGVTAMQYGEKGHAQVPGYPIIPLGAELGAYDNGFYGAGTNLIENRSASTDSWTGTHVSDGSTQYDWAYFTYGAAWTGLYGPNVTGITASVGTEGMNTSYTFSTYTPKFGRFVKYNADRLRKSGQNRLKAQKKFAKEQLTRINNSIKENVKFDRRRRIIGGKKQVPGTPCEVFVGQILEYEKGGVEGAETIKRTVNTVETLLDAAVTSVRDGYENKAFMSLDGLIRPVSIGGDGGLSPFGVFSENCDSSQSQGTIPPVYSASAACTPGGVTGPWYGGDTNTHNQITQEYLNPFANPAGFSNAECPTDKSDESSFGHDVDIVGRGTEPPATGLPMPIWEGWEGAIHADYADDYRIFALKGPILLQQWGYDTDGKPVPNKVDTESSAELGIFETDGLKYKFMDAWLVKPNAWPVGPVDLRWDRTRGVWTSPPERRRVLATLCDNLCPGQSVQADLVTSREPSNLTDKDGSLISYPTITISELHNNCYKEGERISAYYDPYNCDYRVLEGHAPMVEASTGCWEEELLEGASLYFHTLKLGYGLRGKSGDGDDCCEVVLTAGVSISKTGDDCLEPTYAESAYDFEKQFCNDIQLGGGLTAQDGELPCNIILQAGVHFTCFSGDAPTTCSADATDFKFNIALDSAKFAAIDDGNCGIKLSLLDSVGQITINGDLAHTINFTDDFNVSTVDGVTTVALTV